MSRFLKLPLIAFFALVSFFACQNENAEAPPWKHNDNTIRVRQPAANRSLNPFLYGLIYDVNVSKMIFQSLLDFDFETYEMLPELVKSAPVIEDINDGEYAGGQKFVYEIFEEAVWDDGKPVTGHDFVFSLKVGFNPKLPQIQRQAVYLESIADVEVAADNPKKITVFTKDKYILAKPAINNWYVLPEHIYDPEGLLKDVSLRDLRDEKKTDEMAENENLAKFAEAFADPKFAREIVSGSGPYELVEWVDDQRVVLAKKKNWWGDQLADKYKLLAAYPDTLAFIPIPDQSAGINALKGENIDVAYQVDPKQFIDLRNTEFVQPIFDFFTPPTYTIFMTTINNRNPKLSDKRVRRALAHLVDMDLVINDLYDDMGERAIGPVFPDKKYFAKDLKPIPYDAEQARALLEEAGWQDSNGNGIVDKVIDGELTELKLDYLYVPASNYQDNYSELFKNNAQKAGIEINRVAVEANVVSQRRRNGDYELAGWGTSWAPLPDDLKQLWHTDGAVPGGPNYSRFGNAETDALIETVRFTSDEEERNKLYQQIQEIIYDEQPVIFQLIPLERIVVHKRFEPVYSRMGIYLPHFKLKKNG